MDASVRRHFELTYEPGTGRFAHAVDAQIAPDGTAVLFTGSVCDDLESGTSTRIGLARGGQLSTLTAGPNDDHGARWSPDGRIVAFLSDRVRAGQPQLLLLDWQTRIVRATPWLDGVVESLAWRSDGRAMLLGVAGLDADQGDVRGPGRAADRPPGSGLEVAGWEPTIHDGYLEDRSRGAWIYDVARDTVRRLTPATLNVWEAAWCGPSAIIAVTSAGQTEGSWFASELRWIDAAGMGSRGVYRGAYQIGTPVGSPSGRHAAIISGLCSDRGVVPGCPVLIDLDTGAHRSLDSAGVDVTDLTWLDDEELAFIGLRGSAAVAGVVDTSSPGAAAATTWISEVSCGRHIPRASFAANGAMAVVRDSYTEYPAVTIVESGVERVAGSLAPLGLDQLTADGGLAELVSWHAPDGTEIRGWLCRPDRLGPFPLVLHVHGGPVGATTNAWSMGNDTTRLLVGRGYAVLHPNPRGSYGRGQEFVLGVLGDMGGGDAADLLSGVDAMIARGVAEATRLAVVGTSYGGLMANLLPTRDERFAAAVAMSPVTDWQSFQFTSNIPEFASLFLGDSPASSDRLRADIARERSPLSQVSRCRTPTLEVAGHQDLCTPAEQAIRMYDALSAQGTTARLVTYPMAGHGVQHLPALMDLCTQVIGWLDEHLTARLET